MLDSENAIEVRNVKKTFKVFHDKNHTLKEKVLNRKRNKYETREILKGISFDVKRGEAIGLVGHNGCGKSTLLKLLTRIMFPDSGTIELCGRVSSLLELGAGFHPDLSGRENIYINASVFGLSKNEIDRKINDIIEFSELEDFIDNPVRTYSSGMYMRLAFSFSINVNADILLIDEILGVGDVNFQTKCFNRLMEIKETGTTIVVVSHATNQIERICDRSIWIHGGVIVKEGNPIDVHREYMNFMYEQRNKMMEDSEEHEEESGTKEDNSASGNDVDIENDNTERAPFAIVKADIYDSNNKKKKVFGLNEPMTLCVKLNSSKLIENYYIEINLVRADGLFCFGISSTVDSIECEPWNGEKTIMLHFDSMPLLVGKYHMDLHVGRNEGGTILFCGNFAEFEMETAPHERGIMFLKHTWEEE